MAHVEPETRPLPIIQHGVKLLFKIKNSSVAL